MTRNSMLVAAIVAALGLGAGLWFALEPAEEQQVAGAAAPNRDADARPAGQGAGQDGVGQQPSSQTAAIEPAAQPETQADEQAEAEPQTAAADTAPADTAPAVAPAAAPAAEPAIAPAPVPPSFDIVRVERDGSTVVAGRAPAGAEVTLFDGETALATAKVGSDGSFALVLDQPLAPGSRALSLAATTPDGTTVPSTDEVVVVVPEATPAVTQTAAAQTEDAAATSTAGGQTAAAPADATQPAEAVAEPVAAVEEPAAAEPAAAAAAESETAAAEPAATETAATETAATETATTEPAATEPAATETASVEPAVQPTAAPTSAQPATPIVVSTDSEGVSTVLQAPGDLGGDTLRIAAVDYDLDGQVVISGFGPAAGTVALYLDGTLLGQAQVGASGRWVFRPDSPVATGLHRLRADLLAPDGKVIARAEIPFSRAEPIQVAANQDFVVVQPGNSLWVIARGKYGHGLRYTAIYEANAGQIRDPDLIYPGQIFLVPQVN